MGIKNRSASLYHFGGGAWLRTALLAFFAILVVAFVLAVAAGLFHLGFWIAVIAAAIAVVVAISLSLLFWDWHQWWQHALPYVLPARFPSRMLQRTVTIILILEQLILWILAIFFILLAHQT